MTTKPLFLGITTGLMIAACGTYVVQARQQDPRTTGQKIGDSLRGAEQSLERGARAVGDSVKDGWDRAKGAVQKMGVESRVYGRIHWDKDLNGAEIDLEMKDTGVVVLKGTVADEASKTKAVSLAKETLGVTTVIDQLAVTGTPKVVPANGTTTRKTTIKTTTETTPKR